ncbi:MAG: hypothetical protein QG567_214, partial [Campylobacterota bacterium]|nr:hypothetical protein [Campylobacterota bacterium]
MKVTIQQPFGYWAMLFPVPFVNLASMSVIEVVVAAFPTNSLSVPL